MLLYKILFIGVFPHKYTERTSTFVKKKKQGKKGKNEIFDRREYEELWGQTVRSEIGKIRCEFPNQSYIRSISFGKNIASFNPPIMWKLEEKAWSVEK